MLHVLAKNPVFAANPACLADFVKTLVSSPAQEIPTPQPPQDSTRTSDTSLEDSPGKTARKQFWSQFKRKQPETVSSPPPVAEPSQAKTDVEDKELQALLTKPTLVLGEDDGTESVVDEDVVVVDSQATELAQPVTSSQTPLESQVPEIPVESPKSTPEPMLPDRQRFPEEMTDSEQVETPSPPQVATPPPQEPTPSPAAPPQEPTPSPAAPPQDPTPSPAAPPQDPTPSPAAPPQEPTPSPAAPPQEPTPSPAAPPQEPTPSPAAPPQEPTPSPAAPPQEPTPAPTVKVEQALEPAVETPPNPTVGSTESASIAEVLKRASTVDLETGKTPAPPQSLVAAALAPNSTVVLLDVGGIKQPVTVPLSPDQCALAGLEVATANQPLKGGHVSDDGQVVEPSNVETTPVLQPPDQPETSDKQMIKNLYMRFSRSQKRFLKAIKFVMFVYMYFVNVEFNRSNN